MNLELLKRLLAVTAAMEDRDDLDTAREILIPLMEAGLIDRNCQPIVPAPTPTMVVDDDGWLCCPGCGHTEFREDGSHQCSWYFRDQDTESKTLVLRGDFEWFDGVAGPGYVCQNCELESALPEGWEVDYAG